MQACTVLGLQDVILACYISQGSYTSIVNIMSLELAEAWASHAIPQKCHSLVAYLLLICLFILH